MGSLENASHTTAYGGVGLVPSCTGLVGSDTPPGYVARAWFRYGATSMGQRVLRACSRAGALLWRDVADPSLVSRSVSPIDRGRPDRLDVRHSIQYP